MAKRGRKTKDGLRWHKSSKRWYRIYDGKRVHFSPRKTDPADEVEKQRAEVKWQTNINGTANSGIFSRVKLTSLRISRRLAGSTIATPAQPESYS